MEITTACVQALLTEARYLDTKPKEEHDMQIWLCRTTSCAVGDLMVRGVVPKDVSNSYRPFGGWDGVCAALDLSFQSATFLFFCGTIKRAQETPAQTAARIRKFVYWKLKRREIFADYERARRQEGDWHVARSVLELVEAKA